MTSSPHFASRAKDIGRQRLLLEKYRQGYDLIVTPTLDSPRFAGQRQIEHLLRAPCVDPQSAGARYCPRCGLPLMDLTPRTPRDRAAGEEAGS